jgi:hypothetical protein
VLMSVGARVGDVLRESLREDVLNARAWHSYLKHLVAVDAEALRDGRNAVGAESAFGIDEDYLWCTEVRFRR